jgi:hypothetical protein
MGIPGRPGGRGTQYWMSHLLGGGKSSGRREVSLLIDNQDPNRCRSGEVQTGAPIWISRMAGVSFAHFLRSGAIESAFSNQRRGSK